MITQMNNAKRATPYCTQTLNLLPHSLPALLHQARAEIDASDPEAAVRTLNTAKEHHPDSQAVQNLLQKAHIALKRSKEKDYYKVLSISQDASEREIKRAYRAMTKEHHPDKQIAKGIPKEQAEKKMAEINEAYEVLSDPELRARFDRGDDPNSQEQGQPFQGSPFGGGGQQFFFQQGGGVGGFPGGGFKFAQGGGGGGGLNFPGF